MKSAVLQPTGNLFKAALTGMVLPAEGGFSNDKYDSGGKTYKGITEHEARKYGCSDPRDLGDSKINSIYCHDYWNPALCSSFSSHGLAVAQFDTAVNMGLGGAKKVLISALNHMGLNAGKSMSMSQLVALANTCSNQEGLTKSYLQARIERYDSLIAHNGHLDKFRRGWMNRMKSLARFVATDLTGLSLDTPAFEAMGSSGGFNGGFLGLVMSKAGAFLKGFVPEAAKPQDTTTPQSAQDKYREDNEEFLRVPNSKGEDGLKLPVDPKTQTIDQPKSLAEKPELYREFVANTKRGDSKIPSTEDILKEYSAAVEAEKAHKKKAK